jgi:hypothetical protein
MFSHGHHNADLIHTLARRSYSIYPGFPLCILNMPYPMMGPMTVI